MTAAVTARRAALVAALTEQGDLREPAWIEAFTAIPRHEFVPEIIVYGPEGYRRLSGTVPDNRDEWLTMVYSDQSLVIQGKPHAAGYRRPSGEPLQVPTSSSTLPSLMARMLEALDVHGGMRVLEIGTGTGYNAGLLAHRLGSDNVVSIDIDPRLVARAERRLSALGYAPILVAGDGANGVAEHGPYDRIIATAGVPDIPQAWVRQLAPGGKILANLRGDLANDNLCLLAKKNDDDEAIGPVLSLGGYFMWLRPELDSPHRPHEQTARADRAPTSRTFTRSDPTSLPIEESGFRFLLQLQLHGAARLYRGEEFVEPRSRQRRDAIIVTASDGSRAACFTEADAHDVHLLVQSGPRRLWDTVVATYYLWTDLGEPAPSRFGVVANDTTQFVWFNDDHNWNRWPLPLV